MKKYSKKLLAVSIAAACASLPLSAFATNGDELMGLGVQSRALGGTGTAAFYGSESTLNNPAMLGKSTGSEFAIGGTLFLPDVKAESNVTGVSTSETSKADTDVIPEVSMSTRINDNWTFGLGMYGTAGMGVDYRGNSGLMSAYTNLQLMKFVPALAYNQGNFGFGLAPVLQYGALSISYANSGGNVGQGVSTDFGVGYNVGGYYDVNNQLTLGLAYQAAINMKYDSQITDAASGFGLSGFTSNHLEQPAQIRAGVAYTMNNWLVTADYKQIQWSSADGYKDFNWKDQDVYGLGLKYSGSGYWLGVGYNHGNDPISKLASTSYNNEAINMFNNLLFPAVVEDHYSIGGGISLNKTTTLEGAIVYANQTSQQIDTSIVTAALGGSGTTYEKTTHSQMSYTISLRMDF